MSRAAVTRAANTRSSSDWLCILFILTDPALTLAVWTIADLDIDPGAIKLHQTIVRDFPCSPVMLPQARRCR